MPDSDVETAPLGVLAPIVTPCSRTGAVNLEDMRRVCDDLLGAGVNAIFVMVFFSTSGATADGC